MTFRFILTTLLTLILPVSEDENPSFHLHMSLLTAVEMLSSLPTELLRHIIESTVPPSFHSETYFDRLSTLRSLSLVSRRFRQIAQPLLVEIVWIKSLDDLPPIANPRDNRHLVLECYRFKSWSSIEKIKPSPSFEDASLKPTQMLEWSMIRNLTTDCFPLVFEVTRESMY